MANAFELVNVRPPRNTPYVGADSKYFKMTKVWDKDVMYLSVNGHTRVMLYTFPDKIVHVPITPLTTDIDTIFTKAFPGAYAGISAMDLPSGRRVGAYYYKDISVDDADRIANIIQSTLTGATGLKRYKNHQVLTTEVQTFVTPELFPEEDVTSGVLYRLYTNADKEIRMSRQTNEDNNTTELVAVFKASEFWLAYDDYTANAVSHMRSKYRSSIKPQVKGIYDITEFKMVGTYSIIREYLSALTGGIVVDTTNIKPGEFHCIYQNIEVS